MHGGRVETCPFLFQCKICSSHHAAPPNSRYGHEHIAIFQSANEGVKDRNCGANRNASAISSISKCRPERVRQKATSRGMTTINSGASAAGAALYQRILASITAPSCQLLPLRRGIMENERGCAPVNKPAKKCANSWQIVPLRRSNRNAGCRFARWRINNASKIDGSRYSAASCICGATSALNSANSRCTNTNTMLTDYSVSAEAGWDAANQPLPVSSSPSFPNSRSHR